MLSYFSINSIYISNLIDLIDFQQEMEEYQDRSNNNTDSQEGSRK